MPHSAQEESEPMAPDAGNQAVSFVVKPTSLLVGNSETSSAASRNPQSLLLSNGYHAAEVTRVPAKPRSSGHSPWYSRPLVLGVCLGICALVFVVGLVLAGVFPGVFRRRLASSLPLVNGSVTFKTWSSPGADIFMQFWIFNVTNPTEFIAGAKPVLNQIGPFTYLESRQKFDVQFNDSSSTLSYRQTTHYLFRRDLSCCWEDTSITMINLPYVAITYKLRYGSKFVRNIAEKLFVNGGHKLLITRPASELLWGYKDTVLATLAPVVKMFLKTNLNPIVGIFAGKNGSDGGNYSVNTGAADITKLATITSWKGSNKLSFWSTPEANMINGTDGAMFPPFVSQSKKLYLFSSDICRSIYLNYNGDVMLHNAVPLYRFQAPADMFMNSTLNPDNAGFCLQGNCLDSGLLNMSGCVPGTPAVMSQPHFYQAAAQYQDAMLGISPGPEFDTVLDIEPNTGFVMRAAKKLQLNLAIFPVEGFSELSGRNTTLIMPLMWLNESACLDAKSAAKFRDAVLKPQATVRAAQWCLISLGILICLTATAVAFAAHGSHLGAACGDNQATAGSVRGRSGEDPERSEANLLTERLSPAKTPGSAIGAAA